MKKITIALLGFAVGLAGVATVSLVTPGVARASHVASCARLLTKRGCYWCTTNCNCTCPITGG